MSTKLIERSHSRLVYLLHQYLLGLKTTAASQPGKALPDDILCQHNGGRKVSLLCCYHCHKVGIIMQFVSPVFVTF